MKSPSFRNSVARFIQQYSVHNRTFQCDTNMLASRWFDQITIELIFPIIKQVSS